MYKVKVMLGEWEYQNYKIFKREVKNLLLYNAFYTLEEFLHFEGS